MNWTSLFFSSTANLVIPFVLYLVSKRYHASAALDLHQGISPHHHVHTILTNSSFFWQNTMNSDYALLHLPLPPSSPPPPSQHLQSGKDHRAYRSPFPITTQSPVSPTTHRSFCPILPTTTPRPRPLQGTSFVGSGLPPSIVTTAKQVFIPLGSLLYLHLIGRATQFRWP